MTDLVQLRRSLVDVAMGRKAADLVVRNGRWVCVQSGEVIPHTDVAIKNGHFAYVGPDARHCITTATRGSERQRPVSCARLAGCAYARGVQHGDGHGICARRDATRHDRHFYRSP